MKPFFTLSVIFICFLAFQSNAQKMIKTPFIKAGIGYPYVLGNETSEDEHYTIKGIPTLSIEKPFAIEHKRKKLLSINPGLAFYYFKEDEVKGTQTIGRDYKLNHYSVNGYLKLLFQTKLQRRSEAFVYLGPIAGIHILSKTRGNKISYGVYDNASSVEIKENKSGTDFFDLFYYGAVAGFQPNVKKTQSIIPSLEVGFFPGFATKRDEKVNLTNANMIQATVFLGFYQ